MATAAAAELRYDEHAMRPWLRKLMLTVHVLASVGWFGAAASVLALAVAALTARDTGSALYQATEVIWRSTIIPVSVATLLTGIVQGLGTRWGLVRHYWVLTKLVITVAAVLLLALHTRSLLPALAHAAMDASAGVASASAHAHGGMPPRVHLVVASGGTMALLLAAASLSIFKPWGRTPFRRDTPS